MPTNKEIFESSMDALANSINTKAGTTGAKTITQLKAAVDSITPGITPTGNINITTTAQTDVTNYATATVVDANLVAANIITGKTILGVAGSAVVPTGNINITNTNSTNVAQYATAQVVDADLIASNIKKNVNILGVVGTYEGGGITPTGNINITTTSQVDVTNYATAQVVDSDLVATNIKKDVNILGITGTYDPEETIYGEIITDTYGGTTPTPTESGFIVNASDSVAVTGGDIYLKADGAPTDSADRDLRITYDSSTSSLKYYMWNGETEELTSAPVGFNGATKMYIWGNGSYSVDSGTENTVNTTYANPIEITSADSTVNLNIIIYHSGGEN